MDGLRKRAYRGNMASLPVRVFALIAAYAIALHALLSTMTLASIVDNVPPLAVICANAGALDQRGGNDQAPCAPDCMMPGCGTGTWTPPVAGFIATVTPSEVPVSLPMPAQTLGRDSFKRPQVPRAPPLI